MRGIAWLALIAMVFGLGGCCSRRSYCHRPEPCGTIYTNRLGSPAVPPGVGQPSTFTPNGPPPPATINPGFGQPAPILPPGQGGQPAPILPPGQGGQPAPILPPGQGGQPAPILPPGQRDPLFESPLGRMPGSLPDFPGQPGSDRILPPNNPVPNPNLGAQADPWRPSPDIRLSPPLPQQPYPGSIPGVQNPPRVQFGTPFPSNDLPGGSQFSPILPAESRQPPIGGPLPNPAAPVPPAPEPKPRPILPPENLSVAPEPMKQPAPILPPSEPEPPLSIPEKNPVAPPPAPAPIPVPGPEKGPERIQPPVDNTPLPPIDIPGFVQISQGVAAGQQPFPDGATWLQQQGYRSVVHLRAPGSDDQAARRQFESKGLRFYSIEVSPQTVNRQTLEQLTRILDDEKNHPVYFYDRDGYLVGGMWYLKLRIHDMLDSAQALDKAQRLGLNPELNANHRAMWNAVRQLGER